jgi:hypothetical protein
MFNTLVDQKSITYPFYSGPEDGGSMHFQNVGNTAYIKKEQRAVP